MKDKVKILKTLSLLGVFGVLLTGCGESPNPDDNSNDDNTQNNNDVTIGDAQDTENPRPNYGDDFDVVPDYVPDDVDPNKTYTLTLDESSNITFKDGSRTKELKSGESIKLEDLDLSKVGETRKIKGFAEVTQDGKYINPRPLEEFNMPRKALTIIPYFDVQDGFTSLNLGSGSNTYFNFDGVPGSVSQNKTIRYSGNQLISGGKDGYLVNGSILKETSPITKDSAIRLDTSCSLTASIEKGQTAVIEYAFNFSNLGKEPIHLSLYQIGASSEYKNGNLAYEDRYRVDIDLEAGESMHTSPNPQYKLGNNANTLTYIAADESMKNMELGISIAAKKLDIKEPQTVNPPKPVVESKITLDLPSGFTVAPTYKLTGEANKPLILPTEKEITNTTNRKLKGWYIHGENPIKVDSNTRLSEGGVTISPYFEHEEQNYIEALSGKPTKAPDYYDKVSNANNPQSSGLDLKTFSSHLEFINNEESVLLTHQVEFKNDEYIRMLSKANIAIRAGQKYSFKFKLTNKGTEDISFKLAMLQGGTKLDVKDGAVYSDALTIKPNETKETNIEITLINKNNNIMTAILPVTNIHNMNLSIQIFEKEIYDQTEKYTLTLDGTSGVSFNESNTIKLFEGEQLPAIKNTTSREIEGVTYDNKRVKLSDFRMPKKDLTIRPYFKAETGYMRLYSNSGQGNGIPNLCKNGIVETNFEKTCGTKPGYNATFDSSKEVVKLENGFDEEGVRIKYNGEMKTTGEFRTITAPKTSVVAGTHSYKLHYQNNGDERISFDVYFVNSGSDINSCKNNHFELTLDPHQSKTIEVNPTYSKGNGNILMLYKVKDDLKNGLNMVLAMSVKYNK